eukprot:10162029-Lingulodinium_polyedra.AAC.1
MRVGPPVARRPLAGRAVFGWSLWVGQATLRSGRPSARSGTTLSVSTQSTLPPQLRASPSRAIGLARGSPTVDSR